ncbi:nucleoside recognition GATE domain-containing membrane protein YjiH [Seinonella peptonophila]|uniref:Nucleoside recognition GATE domain-containing membrane protein YjiH n=1 Tax=Seinonella peptonophila TaxID=112248 RepID=A0A1M4ZJI1_9BACL|nr:nucleoside recognition GATE domain-containing membrane protein YjiH [Seinonella peptonophila]
MIPISIHGETTILVAFLAKQLQMMLHGILPVLATWIIFVATFFTWMTKLRRPAFIMKHGFLKSLFDVNGLWLIVRTIGLLFAILIIFQYGPELFWSEQTGGLLLRNLIPVLVTVFIFAGLFMPLLMDFGLLELTGALLLRWMRPVFTLPGRCAIDCIASWLGDGTVGIAITNKQYREGIYTKRESAVIGTAFSVVSITFTIVVYEQMNLEKGFGLYYLTIVFAGIVAAIILPRIPPLSRKEDTFYDGSKNRLLEQAPKGTTLWSWGIKQALKRAELTELSFIWKNGLKNIVDLWFGVLPVVMAFGTTAVILAEYTSFFKWISLPFVPILIFFHIPEATIAAQTMVVGFADMFLPAVIASGSIKSEFTRFIIACLSVTQLIYMSEVGGLLLGSSIPIAFVELVIIFLQRTMITLPIITIIAYLFF